MLKGLFRLFGFFAVVVFILTSCEGKGKLTIENPKGADVYINSKHVGKTPLEIELKEGKYDITVTTSEFDRDTQKGVWIYYDKITKMDFNPRPTGILKVDTVPQGAIVMEGRNQIGVTPFNDYIPQGKHLIVFKLGAVGTSRKVNIEYGKESYLKVNLQKAVIHFEGNPEDATLYVDGKEVGKFPQTLEIEEGLHKFTVEKDIYKDDFNLKVKKGDEFNVKFTLEDVQLPPVQAYGPVQFSADNRFFISFGKAGIYFWDTKDLKPHISLWDPEDIRNFDKFSSFAISEDGKLTAGLKPIKALAYKYKDLKDPLKLLVWDNTTASVITNKLLDLKADFITFGGKNSNGVYLVNRSGLVWVVDPKTGNKIKDINLSESITAVKTVKDKIYIGTNSGNILVFNTSTNSIESRHPIHNMAVNSIEVSKDKNYIITASSDKTVKIVNISTMSVEKSISFNSPVMSASLSPMADKLVVGKIDKTCDVVLKDGSKQYSIPLTYIPTSAGFIDENTVLTASSKEDPVINLWYQGHLLKKWVQTIE